jgi:hypothetical protein
LLFVLLLVVLAGFAASELEMWCELAWISIMSAVTSEAIAMDERANSGE